MSQSAVTDPATESCVGVRERAEAPACSKMRSDISSSQPRCFTTPDFHSVTLSNTLGRSLSACLALEYTPPALSITHQQTNLTRSSVTLMEAGRFQRGFTHNPCALTRTFLPGQVIMSSSSVKCFWWINHSSEEENNPCTPFTSFL